MHVSRAPWRLAVWYKQTHDQRLLPLLQAQQHFFEGQDLISAGYSLKGKPLETFTNICFLAPVLCLFQVCVLPLMLLPVSTLHGCITQHPNLCVFWRLLCLGMSAHNTLSCVHSDMYSFHWGVACQHATP